MSELLSLNNHQIRKAMGLSLNEMAVLCDIVMMSNHPAHDYMCVKSKEKMAEWLDLSRDTIYRAINTLEAKGYIHVYTRACKPTNIIYDLITAQEDIALWIKNGNFELLSKKMKELGMDASKVVMKKNVLSQNQTLSVAKSDENCRKIRNELSQNRTQVNNIEKELEKELEKVGETEKSVPTQSELDLTVETINNRSNKKETPEKKPRKGSNLIDWQTELEALGADPIHVRDFISEKKRKKSSFTETAFNGFLREIRAANRTVAEVVQVCAERGWIGFQKHYQIGATPPKVVSDLDFEKRKQEDLRRLIF